MCRATQPPRGTRASADAPRQWVGDARGPGRGQVTQQGGCWEEPEAELPGSCQCGHVRKRWCALAAWAWEARAQVGPCGQTLPSLRSPRTSFLQPGRTGRAVWGLFPPRLAAWGWILASEAWSFYFFSATGSADSDYYRPSFRQRSTSRHLKMGSNILQGQTPPKLHTADLHCRLFSMPQPPSLGALQGDPVNQSPAESSGLHLYH